MIDIDNLTNYTVKFIIDSFISQIMTLSQDELNYADCKKIVLNALASDECADVVSAFYHNFIKKGVISNESKDSRN